MKKATKEQLVERKPLLSRMIEMSAEAAERINDCIVAGKTDNISYKAEAQRSKDISNTINGIKTEIFRYRTCTDKV